MIRVTDLVKIYPNGKVRAVDGVSFTVDEGQFYTLLGPSGCGKTTTLRCIAGLERADGGQIDLDEIAVVSDKVFVPTYRRNLGMVFQSYAVWPHMTVFENVAFPLKVGEKLRKETVRDRVEKALTLVGLEQYGARMATQLSGGQQQRLSLARAIVREPKVLLLDEPLSNLDAKLRERMRGELSAIQRRLGVTTLFVTHDQIEALSMSDSIAVMDGGKIVQEGTPQEIYHRPANEFVASFIGSTNLFKGELDGEASQPDRVRVRTEFGLIECQRDPGVELAQSVILAIRPEDIVLHHGAASPAELSHANVYESRIGIGLFTGTSVEYYLDVGDALIQGRTGSRETLKRGDRVHLEIPPEACRVFSLQGEPKVRLTDHRLARLARIDDGGDG